MYQELENNKGVSIEKPQYSGGYYAFQFINNPYQVLANLKENQYDAWKYINERLYDPHLMMADVLGAEYRDRKITYVEGQGSKNGYVARTTGQCDFCVNKHWTFPQGCPYGKV